MARHSQLAWQWSRTLPSPPTPTLRLALASSWAGHRAAHWSPLWPDGEAPPSRARTRWTGESGPQAPEHGGELLRVPGAFPDLPLRPARRSPPVVGAKSARFSRRALG